MKKIDEYSFSKKVNSFIDSISKHNNTIEVYQEDDGTTVIVYEDWAEHEPIRNFKNKLSERFENNEERIRKISEAHKGVKFSEEHKEAISKAMKGKPKSAEHSRKISEAKKKYYEDLKRKYEM